MVRTYQLPEVHSQMSVVMHPERVHTMLLGGSEKRQEQANDLFRSALMGAPIATRCQYDSCSGTLKDTPSVHARTAARRLWLVHPRDGQLVPHLGALIVRVVSEGVDASGIEVYLDSRSVDQPCGTAAGTP
jgi:hypothetical protein